MKRKIVIIVGPTAVGKTDIAIEVAKTLDTEIISSDSVQIYKNLNIGSAKPTLEEMKGIKHHLMDFISPEESYSVSEFYKGAKVVIDDLFTKNRIPVITGGTGLYVNTLLYEMNFGETASDEPYREMLEEIASEQGSEVLHEMLKAVDEAAAERIHPNNVRRVIRALEVNRVTGKPIGDFSMDPVKRDEYEVSLIGLKRNRLKLYARINSRVDIMINQGLLDEVKNLKELGLNDSFQSMQGIGYKEVLAYLNGSYDYETMVSLLKQNSRRYAKRQMTWFRRYEDIKWIDLDEVKSRDEVVRMIVETI